MPRAFNAQITDHMLDAVKGWPRESAVDFEAKFDPAIVQEPIHEGRVAHVNAAGLFGIGAEGHQMPIFLLRASDDFDVNNDGGGKWESAMPHGVASGLVATGAYELQVTEYADGDYAPNDLLTSPSEATVGAGHEAQAGLLYNTKSWHGGDSSAVAAYDIEVCGVVSRGVRPSGHPGISVLAFWPVFIPADER